MFYSRLSTGIAVANKESFKNILDPDCEPEHQQNLIEIFLEPSPMRPKNFIKICSYFFG